MAEILEAIRQLHDLYEKLILKNHDWQKHRTLVINIKGFHRVVISFPDLGSIVCQRDRNHGSFVTPERTFDSDDPKLLEKLVEFIESGVRADEWEIPAVERSAEEVSQAEIDGLLQQFESD